jgi:hypothetical protein
LPEVANFCWSGIAHGCYLAFIAMPGLRSSIVSFVADDVGVFLKGIESKEANILTYRSCIISVTCIAKIAELAEYLFPLGMDAFFCLNLVLPSITMMKRGIPFFQC